MGEHQECMLGKNMFDFEILVFIHKVITKFKVETLIPNEKISLDLSASKRSTNPPPPSSPRCCIHRYLKMACNKLLVKELLIFLKNMALLKRGYWSLWNSQFFQLNQTRIFENWSKLCFGFHLLLKREDNVRRQIMQERWYL